MSSRYEHSSLILTSDLAFAHWGDIFGDQVFAAAMIDRIVHYADVLPSEEAATGSLTEASTHCLQLEQRTRHNRANVKCSILNRQDCT